MTSYTSSTPSYLVYLLLILLLVHPIAASPMTVAQNKATAEPNPVQDSARTPKQRALALLNQLVRQTGDFEGLNKNFKVILFQEDVADVLWDYDQTQARGLFENGVKSAGALIPKRPAGRPLSFMDTQMYSEVCGELVDSALAHDAAFAERIASLALAPLKANESKGEEVEKEYRRQAATLYSQIAKHLASSDPQHAAELIRLTFSIWYSADQIAALVALRRRDPALADGIFLSAMTMIRNKPTNLSTKVGILAPYVFPDIENGINAALRRSADADPQAQASPAMIKSFLEFVYETFMPQPIETLLKGEDEFGFAFFDRFTMQELIPRFERYLPDKAAAFRVRVEEVTARMKQGGSQAGYDSEGEAFGELYRSNVQDWIDKAEAAKTQKERDDNYHTAIEALLIKGGDSEQALALVSKLSDSESSKPYILKMIREGQVRKAIAEGDAEQAYHYSELVQTKEQDADSRPYLLMQIARLFAKSGNVKRAKEVLEEVQQLTSTKAYNERHMIRRATVAVEIDPAYGFLLMKEAIEVINASGFAKSTNGYSFGDRKIDFDYRHDFEENLGVLARTDFNQALELAKSIKPKEVSLLAQLAVCKGVLIRTKSSSEKVPAGTSR